jgi:signal transduction histidine kinase
VLERFRDRAARLANSIANDLPGFTGHDVEHLDALWATADVVAGDDWSLNPVEAFVFGGAVLLHDLALSTAAYLDGPDSVEQGEDFADRLRLALRAQLGREATVDELVDPPPAVRNAAREAVLRSRHHRRASELVTVPLQGPGGELYLLDDSDLRDDLEWLIGQIAASHGWTLIEVNATLAPLQPTPKDLGGFSVDALSIACMLRCADACQLDGRRARALQQAVQQPTGTSADHWNFQRRLHPARREDDRLIFESTRPFEPQLTDAWWLAYEWLSLADGELRAVDALLADRRPERRFSARSVAGTDAPERLAERVKTEGWLPVDARLHVSNVVELARRVGGRQLYGQTAHVPLRELVQNGSDAVRARRALDSDASGGSVIVALRARTGGAVLEVRDDGVGMTENVMTGPLLDFGTSLWDSPAIAEHLPGLAAHGFRSVGRFGIGFFAAFMGSPLHLGVTRWIR